MNLNMTEISQFKQQSIDWKKWSLGDIWNYNYIELVTEVLERKGREDEIKKKKKKRSKKYGKKFLKLRNFEKGGAPSRFKQSELQTSQKNSLRHTTNFWRLKAKKISKVAWEKWHIAYRGKKTIQIVQHFSPETTEGRGSNTSVFYVQGGKKDQPRIPYPVDSTLQEWKRNQDILRWRKPKRIWCQPTYLKRAADNSAYHRDEESQPQAPSRTEESEPSRHAALARLSLRLPALAGACPGCARI